MFSGIIEAKAKIVSNQNGRLELFSPWEMSQLSLGQSVAVDGCCLTVVRLNSQKITFDISPETLDRTMLGRKKPGDTVNLERSILMGGHLDGHLVAGHIDGRARVRSIQLLDPQGSKKIWIDPEHFHTPWVIEKGSATLNGVSLTVNEIDPTGFSVVLIPHTLEVTTLGELREGDWINLEYDLLGKYVEKLVHPMTAAKGATTWR